MFIIVVVVVIIIIIIIIIISHHFYHSSTECNNQPTQHAVYSAHMKTQSSQVASNQMNYGMHYIRPVLLYQLTRQTVSKADLINNV